MALVFMLYVLYVPCYTLQHFPPQIGLKGTSFWEHTGQESWCGSASDYGDQNDGKKRCPKNEPSWCICKWATADWIKGEGCNDSIQFVCESTDVCNVKKTYTDMGIHGPVKITSDVKKCMAKKCKKQCPGLALIDYTIIIYSQFIF